MLGAWRQYKELRSLFGRHCAVVNGELSKFNHINYQFRYFAINSRAEYKQNLVNKYADSPKLFHSYIQKKKKGRIAVGPLRLPSGEIVDGVQDMAEAFADEFASVFVNSDSVDPALYQVFNGTMPDVVITADKVCRVLQDLNCDTAMG